MNTRLLIISIFLCALTLIVARNQHPVERSAYSAGARARLAPPSEVGHPNGEFSANVKTAVGEFRVPVQVAANKVECIHWSERNCLRVFNAPLSNGIAEGMSANGDLLQIEITE